jgi:HD domain
MMIEAMFSVENLMEIVKAGGRIKAGVDVYNEKGTLLLEKNIFVDSVRTLKILQQNGIRSVPVSSLTGGLWDGKGNLIRMGSHGGIELVPPLALNKSISSNNRRTPGDIEKRLKKIQEIKKETLQKFDAATACLKTALNQIRGTHGQFDVQALESQVADLVSFSIAADHPFPYLNREIFSWDDYLYQHSTNVCAIGTAVLHRFNTHFSQTIGSVLSEKGTDFPRGGGHPKPVKEGCFRYYYKEELNEICLGFFLHDIGKAMVPEALLNKSTGLTDKEFDILRRHSFDYGAKILEENRIKNSVLKNIVQYHHAPLFDDEQGCYPRDRDCLDIPPYVKICKLADIYDAMISKKSYKDALNQVSAMTRLFRKYVKKDSLLQFILHAFVKSIGRHPPGSIVYLKNGQMAYVLESDGPLVLPFTDTRENTLKVKPDPIDVGSPDTDAIWQIDSERSIRSPREVYNLLPLYIKMELT